MSVIVRLKTLTAVLVLLATTAIVAAEPAAAKIRYQPVRAPFGWQQVDRDGNGDITRKEWKWAEKHGYNRLDNHRVSRKEYQAQLNRYLAYLSQRQARYRDWNSRDWDDRDDNRRIWQRDWDQAGDRDGGRADRDHDGEIWPWWNGRQ